MKGLDDFKKAIQIYLEKRGKEDILFAETLKKENKSLDGCVSYILNEVKRKQTGILSDQDTYNLAVHYYDEDDIKEEPLPNGVGIGSSGSSNSKTPIKKVELTAEEIKQAEELGRQKAIEQAIEKKKQQALAKASKKSKPEETQGELTLF